MATVVDAEPVHGGGPIPEYDRRVAAGRLRNDEHQRGEDHWEKASRHVKEY
jgi:protein AFG1